MAYTAQRYYARAPRHTLMIDENRGLRFAWNNQIYSHDSIVLNVSITGLAFYVDASIAPNIGDFIKIEFFIPPGEQQVACYAKVVRKESNTNVFGYDLIAVHFEKLTLAHRIAFKKHLTRAFHLKKKKFALAHLHHLILYGIVGVGLLAALILIQQRPTWLF